MTPLFPFPRPEGRALLVGVPSGIRTRVLTLKGWRPGPD